MDSSTYPGFGCVEVHREINTVEDPFWHIGPVSYRRINSSSKRTKQLINQSCFHFRDFAIIDCFKLTKKAAHQLFLIERKHSHVHSSLSKSAPVGCRLARHVGKFLQSPNCKHHRRPKTLQFTDGFHSSDTLTGSDRRETHPSWRGTSCGMKGGGWEMGFSQRWVWLHGGAHSAAPPLHSAARGETNRRIYYTHTM